MLIICQIFHISTHHISNIFTTDLRLALWFFVAPSFFWAVRAMCFFATRYRCLHVRRDYCSFMVFEGWRALDVMFFLRRAIVFLILGALSRICRLFALFSLCWLPINTFFSLAFPRCRRSVPMFFNCFFNVSCETLLFSLWNITSSLFVFYSIRGDILRFLLSSLSGVCVLSHGFVRLARRLSSIGVYRSSMSWHNFLAIPDRNTMLRFYVRPLIF